MSSTAETGNLFLGDGVVAIGTALVPGKAVFNGTYDGALSAKEVEVQSKGVVSGTTQASTISVAGKLNTSIEASEMLSIESSGTVTGNVAYRKLEVAKGGELLGTLKQL